MKFPVFAFLIVFIHLAGHSQGIRSGNIYRVTVTSQYELENGERTNSSFTVNQKLYDSLGRLHTDIDFDNMTRYPNDYRWHYYDSMLLVRTEYYNDELLESRVVFEYGQDTIIHRELYYRPVNDDTLLVKVLSYSYNSEGLPERIDAHNENGRRLYRIRLTYDNRGTEIGRRVAGRRGEPADSIRRLDREAEYDGSGLLAIERVRLRMSDRSRKEFTRRYEYDERGKLTGITELDAEGNQLSRTEYVWQHQRDRLGQIRYYDANDQLESFYAKRYEIYRTPDRRQRIIDY